MKDGRFFTDAENRHHMPVVVVGEDVPKALMAGEDPIGKWIDVDGHEFEIIGVMERPAASFPGQDDTRVLMPVLHDAQDVSQREGEHADRDREAGQAGRGHRRSARRAAIRSAACPPNKPDNFSISTSEQMVEQFHSVTAMVALVMVVLSSIGLLVGGIGVMNIMLVSVTERTREIGVRKAIGARRVDIVVQFLTEAVVLTGLGGLIGMTFGWIDFAGLPAGLSQPADRRAAVGRGVGVVRVGGGGPVLRNLAGEQGRAPGSGGGAALRVTAAIIVLSDLRLR